MKQSLAYPRLEQDVRQALKDWHNGNQVDSPLAYLYLWRKTQRTGYPATRQATNQVLLEALAVLKETQEAAAQFLQMRFLDLLPVHQLANQLNVAESTIYNIQREAIQQLTNTLRLQEQQASVAQKIALESRLPAATSVSLVGFEARCLALLEALKATQAPWLIAIEGMGGVGKTSLAHAVVTQAIQQGFFDEVGWVSARAVRLGLNSAPTPAADSALYGELVIENLLQQLAPKIRLTTQTSLDQKLLALQRRLKATPHLIVIDSLDTLLAVESLLPILQKLANPSKFILTARARLYTELNLYHMPLTELSEEDALWLLRQEARLSNLPIVANSTNAELLPIIEAVGGNPLALRLIVGQMHIHPLQTLLTDLREARGATVENFYTFIYRQAWDSLDELSRRVLLLMPLAGTQAGDLAYLAKISGLEVDKIRLALNKLIQLNLVDVCGDLYARQYSIHRLTYTFLQSQAAKWKNDESAPTQC